MASLSHSKERKVRCGLTSRMAWFSDMFMAAFRSRIIIENWIPIENSSDVLFVSRKFCDNHNAGIYGLYTSLGDWVTDITSSHCVS